MSCMETQPDLVFDPNEVGPYCVVECWISQRPRAADRRSTRNRAFG